MTRFSLLLAVCLTVLAGTVYAGAPEAPALLPDDFCSRLSSLVEMAPNGFFQIRGEQNPNPKLPNSKEWYSQMGFSGSTVAMVSDVPEMGNYNFKTVWQEGSNLEKAMSLEKALVERVKECLNSKGWDVQEVQMPSNASSESWLFIIRDPKNPQFSNVNVMVSFNDKGSYEVSLKVTYSI